MFFFFKQKTAYEMRISDWSSDVCSSDLLVAALLGQDGHEDAEQHAGVVRRRHARGAGAHHLARRSEKALYVDAARRCRHHPEIRQHRVAPSEDRKSTRLNSSH